MKRIKRIAVSVAGIALLLLIVSRGLIGHFFYFHKNISTDTSGATFSTLDEKINFLRRYVSFPTPVQAVEFHVVYHDNDWAPSDWEIQTVAKVKPSELHVWTNGWTAVSKDNKIAWINEIAAGNSQLTFMSSPTFYGQYGRPCSRLVVFEKESVVAEYFTTMGCPALK